MTPQEAVQELKDASDSEVRYGDTEYHYNDVMKRVEAFDMAIKALEQQPKRGKWIRGFGMGNTYSWFYECSKCGEQVKGDYCGCNYNYCPYCGSDNRDLESLGESFADGYEDGLEET